MKTKFAVLMAGVFVATAIPVLAHHAVASEYDRDKPVSVKGVVTKLEWNNPHIWFYVDVKDADGKVTNWGFIGGPPGVLVRRGITKNVLKPGDVVQVQGFQAKDGSHNASGGDVTFADGRKVFAGSAEDSVLTER